MEQWEWIKGHEGVYQVSTHGRIKSFIGKEKILKGYVGNHGYSVVNVGGKLRPIHRLVAETFIPNIDNKDVVDHLDRVRTNNYVTNLEWVTYSQNNKRRHDRNWQDILKKFNN